MWRRLAHSVGMTPPEPIPDQLQLVPEQVWTAESNAEDQVRDRAWIAELSALMDRSSWPAGMPVVVHKERPHPAAKTGSGWPRTPGRWARPLHSFAANRLATSSQRTTTAHRPVRHRRYGKRLLESTRPRSATTDGPKRSSPVQSGGAFIESSSDVRHFCGQEPRVLCWARWTLWDVEEDNR